MGKTVTVGQLNSYIDRVLRGDTILNNVSVKGEISNLTYHSSGHVYFSLKDRDSKINCFLPRNVAQSIPFRLKEDMEIIATGNIAVFKRGGYYSLQIKNVTETGTGELARKFEELKRKLEREGLFDQSYKKSIPAFPNKIAVLTAKTGAAVEDIIRTIKNKNNYVDILICPVQVQGPDAAQDIANMIEYVNSTCKDVDVMIVGRGGGSMEDLWAFNEEVLAWSIYKSDIPIVSAVGHEPDVTIADYVADARAATPTAAAEMVAPNINEIKANMVDRIIDIKDNLRKVFDMKRRHLEFFSPDAFETNLNLRINYYEMSIDAIIDDMNAGIERNLLIRSSKLDSLNPESSSTRLISKLDVTQARLDSMEDTMRMSIYNKIETSEHKLEAIGNLVEASNPKSILSRGYSVIKNGEGRILNSTETLKPGDNLFIETAKGTAEAEVTKVKS